MSSESAQTGRGVSSASDTEKFALEKEIYELLQARRDTGAVRRTSAGIEVHKHGTIWYEVSVREVSRGLRF
jgi:hypothetical protein